MNDHDVVEILLVEDNPDDEALTIRALNKHNVANGVVVARDGAEALDYLYRRGAFSDRTNGAPIVVLLDLKMPRVDGFEFLSWLRREPGRRADRARNP